MDHPELLGRQGPKMETSIEVAAEILDQIEHTQILAERGVRKYFRKHPELSNEQRAQAAKYVHGVRCHLRALDYQLLRASAIISSVNRIGAYKIIIEDSLAADVAVQLKTPELSKIDVNHLRWPEDSVERLSIQYSLPNFVAEALARQLGDEEAALLADSMNHPGPITIRARAFSQDRETLQKELEKENCFAQVTPRARHGLYLTGKPDIRGSKLWQAGAYEVQDEGSQLIAEALDAQPGEHILDLCAGAGGKTLALIDHMNQEGLVYAADIDAQRLQDLRVRLLRTQITCVQAIHLPRDPLPKNVDRVLVDAPCSSTGTWRRGPDRKWHLRLEDLKRLTKLQAEILRTGWDRLRVGGLLVYATCSILDVENMNVIQEFLDQHSNATLFHQESLYPHRDNTDGFFIASLVKSP